MSTYAPASVESDRQIPALVGEVEPGWQPLLMGLHERLVRLAPDYRLEELTAKLGGLQMYIADRFDEYGEFDGDWADTAGALRTEIEALAQQTCEVCGDTGRTRFHGALLRTMCDVCHYTGQETALSLGWQGRASLN
ncbi:hypothetical protein SRB5_64280 [Streptomyces sp. RB5]|uniref:Uncharacterized protein n=1 Tax=Streptomyces smaragdinus TaxID=2585196 RepID=A0A7K0CS28_9ACTN|nr:hypothetical protein [Streptomyces smaragdinus]MQY16230.1 hypothetical protein [Streptomyces smaragdinus]